MIKIGVTGGIGSGKTTVCNIFKVLGIPVYNADEEARRLMQNDPLIISEIKKLFGNEVYHNEELNRAKIAGIVFGNKELLNELNSIVHPAVGKHFNNWANSRVNQPYIIKEAAILFESGANKGLDYVITITAPEKLRIRRIMNRDGISSEDVKRRMKNQWTDKKIQKLSDFTITNDDKKMVLPQVLKLHQFFISINGTLV